MSERQRQVAREYHFKHGEAPGRNGKQPTAEYRAWRAMIDRCYLRGHKVFKNHGARGIKVCRRWRHDYLAFLSDMQDAYEEISKEDIEALKARAIEFLTMLKQKPGQA